MPIPDFQTLMLPVLKFASENDEHSLREAVNYLKEPFSLTPEEKPKSASVRLAELGTLKEQNLISEDEYNNKRTAILDDM